MLDVNPGATLVLGVKVKAGKLRPDGSVTSPTCQTFACVQEVSVPVQVIGEPDVVVHAAIAIFDDVDVAVMVDCQVVRRAQPATHWKACRKIEGIAVGEDRDLLGLQFKTVNFVSGRGRDVEVFAVADPLDLQVLRALVVGALERSQIRGVASVH